MGCAEVVVTPSWGGGGPPVASSEASEVPPTGIPEERRTRDSCQGPKVCPEQDRMRHSCGETSVVGGHLGEAVGQVQTQEGGPHWAGRRVRNTQRVSAWLSPAGRGLHPGPRCPHLGGPLGTQCPGGET